MRRTLDDAYDLLKDMILNAFNWQSERSARKPIGVHSIHSYSSLTAQIEALQKHMYKMNTSTTQPQMVSYDFCGRGHASIECQAGNPFAQNSDQAYYVGIFKGHDMIKAIKPPTK